MLLKAVFWLFSRNIETLTIFDNYEIYSISLKIFSNEICDTQVVSETTLCIIERIGLAS